MTLDLDGQTGVAHAATIFRFVNPAAGKTIDDVTNDVSMFLARAGADEVPRPNETLDRFVAAALARDLPVTVVNHPGAPHAFDLFHDSETSREIIRRMLAFLQFHLKVVPIADRAAVIAPAPLLTVHLHRRHDLTRQYQRARHNVHRHISPERRIILA